MNTRSKYHHYTAYGQFGDQREEITTADQQTAVDIVNTFKRLNADYVGIDASNDAEGNHIDSHWVFWERPIPYIEEWNDSVDDSGSLLYEDESDLTA